LSFMYVRGIEKTTQGQIYCEEPSIAPEE
jgi:hypothetical protein